MVVAKKCHVQTPRDSVLLSDKGSFLGSEIVRKRNCTWLEPCFYCDMANVFLLKNDKIQRERENFFMIMMSSKDKAGLRGFTMIVGFKDFCIDFN